MQVCKSFWSLRRNTNVFPHPENYLHFFFAYGFRCKAPAPVGAAPMKNKPMRVKRLKLPLTSGAVDKGYFG